MWIGEPVVFGEQPIVDPVSPRDRAQRFSFLNEILDVLGSLELDKPWRRRRKGRNGGLQGCVLPIGSGSCGLIFELGNKNDERRPERDGQQDEAGGPQRRKPSQQAFTACRTGRSASFASGAAVRPAAA